MGCFLAVAAAPVNAQRQVGALDESGRASGKNSRREIPDKLVVLTFDDSAKTHFTVVRPLLKQYGFRATFFITEGWDFKSNKRDYMTWGEIAQLHKDGFEIGNHTRDHLGITDKSWPRLDEQLAEIEKQCLTHGIPKPVTFAWPGNATTPKAFDTLRRHGILFARRGGAPEYPYQNGRGFAFESGKDHPFLLPSAGDARPTWTLADLIRAVEQARDGKIAVLQFHGAPDTAHAWVSTPQENFAAFVKYLAINKYQVVSLRELVKFVDPRAAPADPMAVIRERQAAVADVKKGAESDKP